MFFSVFNNRTRTNNTPLVRVWRATGNPRAPLAAVWLTPAQAATLTPPGTAAEDELPLCA